MSNLLERNAKMLAYEDAIALCRKEIKAVKRAELRTRENTGAYSKLQVLNKFIRIFKQRLRKLDEENR